MGGAVILRSPAPIRRSGSVSRRLFLEASLLSSVSLGMGRIPYGGQLILKLPWNTGQLDPHRLGHPISALLASAIAEPLFALDSQGRPYPTLAADLPRSGPAGTRLTLRAGLRSARGKPLEARDILFSLERARNHAAQGWLAPVPTPRVDPRDPLSVLFNGADETQIAQLLSNPITALVPRGFSAHQPDGTGPFIATPGEAELRLDRNLNAARGASYLNQIRVVPAKSLGEALRAFETGETDLGWLGSGLHRPRPGAVAFDSGRFGWAVLRTGGDAGAWGAPGVAQQLLDGIPGDQLAHLGLADLPRGTPATPSAWGGPPCDLWVEESAPQLVEIARVLAATLSRPGHEITVSARSASDLESKDRARKFTLWVDFVRSLGASPAETQMSLLTAANPSLARTPPRIQSMTARAIGQSLSLGIVGELRAQGALAAGIAGFSLTSLGTAYRKR